MFLIGTDVFFIQEVSGVLLRFYVQMNQKSLYGPEKFLGFSRNGAHLTNSLGNTINRARKKSENILMNS